jgi:hypothetical protein
MSQVLVISHHIHLTREQRYELHNNGVVETTGVSMPIWHYKGETSEPGSEIFCTYLITNDPAVSRVYCVKTGYEINLPQIPLDYKPTKPFSDLEWRGLTKRQQEDWYLRTEPPASSKNLLDLVDGGSNGFLFFTKMDSFRRRNKNIDIVHEVQFIPMEKLVESLLL